MRCNHCRREIDINTAYAGQKMECPFCKHLFICPKGVASEIDVPKTHEHQWKYSVAWIIACIIMVITCVCWLFSNAPMLLVTNVSFALFGICACVKYLIRK